MVQWPTEFKQLHNQESTLNKDTIFGSGWSSFNPSVHRNCEMFAESWLIEKTSWKLCYRASNLPAKFLGTHLKGCIKKKKGGGHSLFIQALITNWKHISDRATPEQNICKTFLIQLHSAPPHAQSGLVMK